MRCPFCKEDTGDVWAFQEPDEHMIVTAKGPHIHVHGPFHNTLIIQKMLAVIKKEMKRQIINQEDKEEEMPTFTPNPQAEAQLDFDVIQPGVYPVRIKEVLTTKKDGSPLVDKNGKEYVSLSFDYVDPSSILKLDGTPAKNPGSLFENYVSFDPDQQWKLRSIVEACGLEWGTVNSTDALIGQELQVKVKLGKTQDGEQRNEISRYVQQEV